MNSVHISDHIHEWRRRQRLIKATIPDQLLDEWFTKSLLPPISHDVTMGGVVTEEEAIARAQYLDLVYSQSGTLYELIPNDPRTSTDPSKPSSTSPHMQMESSVPSKPNLHHSRIQSTNHSVSAPVTGSTSLSSTSPPPTQISEVNAVQSASSQQSGERRKRKINPKIIIIIMKIQKHKLHHLLLKRNHNENRNSHVSFVVMIITPETVLIATKLQKFSKGIPNPLC
jgi:hypothetical protein